MLRQRRLCTFEINPLDYFVLLIAYVIVFYRTYPKRRLNKMVCETNLCDTAGMTSKDPSLSKWSSICLYFAASSMLKFPQSGVKHYIINKHINQASKQA